MLLDESLPRYLKHVLSAHEVVTVQEMGRAGITNGELLAKIESNFDAFLTADKNLRHQQNLRDIKFAIIVFLSNRLTVVKQLAGHLNDVLVNIHPGEIIEL